MSYQLRRNQTLGDNLRRICQKQVEGALEIVRGEREANDTPVHETRKHLKKARAALQMVSDEIGRPRFKKQDHCFRDIGPADFGRTRRGGALANGAAITGDHRRTSQQTFHKQRSCFWRNWNISWQHLRTGKKQAAPQLEKLQAEIEAWPVENLDCKNIRCAAQRAYKTARHALDCAKTKPTPENFHEFRSEAKRLLCQLRILRPINPLVIGALIDDLDSVGEIFGRSHDLYFLANAYGALIRKPPARETRNWSQ